MHKSRLYETDYIRLYNNKTHFNTNKNNNKIINRYRYIIWVPIYTTYDILYV